MHTLTLDSDKNLEKIKYEDPFLTSTYRTQVDKIGIFSHYKSGNYKVYTSYEYNGRQEIITYDGELG